MSQRCWQNGFTLLELVVVLVLLTFAAGLVLQRVGGSSEQREARMFAKELAAFLKKARRTAVNTGGSAVVWISAQDRVCTFDEAELAIPEVVRLDGKRIRRNEEGVPYVRFDPDGGSSGGELIVMVGPDVVAALRIDGFTGSIAALRKADGDAG